MPIFDTEGEVIGFRGVDRDITDRKRSEIIQSILFNISNAVNTTETTEALIQIIRIELSRVIDTNNFYIAFYNSDNHTFTVPFIEDEKLIEQSFPAGQSLTYHVVKTNKSLLQSKNQFSLWGLWRVYWVLFVYRWPFLGILYYIFSRFTISRDVYGGTSFFQVCRC